MVKLETSGLGIVAGDDKRVLERYVGEDVFRQRKSYDEYYLECSEFSLELSLSDLHTLAGHFTVEVSSHSVVLSEY